MRANSKLIPRCGRLAVCLLLALGCAPDQFVSMGSDIGAGASDPHQSSSPGATSGSSPSATYAIGGEALSAGGSHFGGAGGGAGPAESGNGVGGFTSNTPSGVTGGTGALSLGIPRQVFE